MLAKAAYLRFAIPFGGIMQIARLQQPVYSIFAKLHSWHPVCDDNFGGTKYYPDYGEEFIMRAWIGKSVIFIGIIHSAFGFAVFRSTLAKLAAEGIVNTVNGQPEREFVFWFLAFGFMAIFAGALIDWCERKIGTLPAFTGWYLLALTVILVTIMPISGAWLLLIPAIGAILRSRGLSRDVNT